MKPNKRLMIPLFEEAASNNNISETEFSSMVRKMHKKARGHAEIRSNNRDRDVIAYPVPECMCKH